MRTGAMSAIGAKHLARRHAKVLGHIGARGTAYWNVRLIDHLFDCSEIRVHSRRPESRREFADTLSRDLGKPVVATEDWESCVRGADIVVEASRLPEPQPLLRTEWIAPGALVIPYGTMSAVEITLTDIMSKIVVDDWGQCRKGMPFGALRRHVDEGRLHEGNLHAELGQIVCGRKPGRERDDETILFWHRGLATSDIALGCALLDKAKRLGRARRCDFNDRPLRPLSQDEALREVTWIACTRMYDVTPEVRAHWHALLQKVARAAGVELECIDHAAPRFPQPICGSATISRPRSSADFRSPRAIRTCGRLRHR
jgi:hypothetical protein